MSLKFCSFASGSSGNCYLVKNDSGALLIDAGISGKKIFAGLEETDTAHEEVLGVLITHEHIDHVKSLPIVTKKLPNAYAYANESTWESIERPVENSKKKYFHTGEDFNIGQDTGTCRCKSRHSFKNSVNKIWDASADYKRQRTGDT